MKNEINIQESQQLNSLASLLRSPSAQLSIFCLTLQQCKVWIPSAFSFLWFSACLMLCFYKHKLFCKTSFMPCYNYTAMDCFPKAWIWNGLTATHSDMLLSPSLDQTDFLIKCTVLALWRWSMASLSHPCVLLTWFIIHSAPRPHPPTPTLHSPKPHLKILQGEPFQCGDNRRTVGQVW